MAHGDFDDIRVLGFIPAPDLCQQLAPREHPLGIAHTVRQQLEGTIPELQPPPTDLIANKINNIESALPASSLLDATPITGSVPARADTR